MPSEPRPSRPHMPADYLDLANLTVLLAWDDIRGRWEQAKIYWICSVRPNARPHISPVWGVWLDDTLYFDGSPETRRMRNIAANPYIAVHLESDSTGNEAFSVEGSAYAVDAPDHGLTARIAAAYCAKYAVEGYAPTPTQWDSGGLFAMQPHVALGWTSFTKDATRWHFTHV